MSKAHVRSLLFLMSTQKESISTSFVKHISHDFPTIISQPIFPIECVSIYAIKLMEIPLN